VDALVQGTEEGRIRRAIRVGEVPKTFDPAMSEWGNPHCFTAVFSCSKISTSVGILKHVEETTRTETSK